MRVKINKHINKKYIGLVGEVNKSDCPYLKVNLRGGIIECFRLNIEETQEPISNMPINYSRDRNNKISIKPEGKVHEYKSENDDLPEYFKDFS